MDQQNSGAAVPGGEGGGDLMALMDPATAAAPQEMYHALRRDCPVLRVGDGAVAVSSREAIEEIFRHPEVFSSAMSATELGNIRPLIPLQIDPPDHVRFRRLLDPLFAPRQVAHLEEGIRRLVHQRIDAFAHKGSCDLVQELTVPLPSEVFLNLFGLPMSDLPQFLAMKDGIIRPPGDTDDDRAAHRTATAQSIYDYFDAVLDERGDTPHDDLLGRFVAAEVEGERLSREDILDICFLMLIAGLDTVTATLDCSFAYLARNPEARRRLVEEPETVNGAVEELLRWETPVSGVARLATQDTVLDGTEVKKGDQVFVMLGSANIDETDLPDPDLVDFSRSANRHLAFGGGVHRCLGSHLARLELRTVLREFHLRIPEYELAPDADLVFTVGIRSLDALPLVWDPAVVR